MPERHFHRRAAGGREPGVDHPQLDPIALPMEAHEVGPNRAPPVEAELAVEHEKLAGGVEKAMEIGVVDEVVEPAVTRSALARALADADQGVRGQHGNIPL